MGFFGSILNSLTGPVGIKLFPGGPYPDAGYGDVMERNLEQYKAQIAPLIAQIAQMAGVGNPLTGSQGQFQNDPYGLSPLQQGAFNRQAGFDAQSYQNIMSKVKADLASRGMGSSSTLAAAEAYLQSQLSGQVAGERIQAGENAYQNRNQALQQIAQLISGQYQAGQQVAGSQQNTALFKQQQAMSQLGSALGLGLTLGGVIPGMGTGSMGAGGMAPRGPGGVAWGTPPFNPSGGTGTGLQFPEYQSQLGGLLSQSWGNIYR